MARLNAQTGYSRFWRRVLLCVLMCVGGGAIYAATEYKWQDGQTSTVGGNAVYEWSNYKNWQYLGVGWQNISDSSADYPGQNANGHDNTTAIVYLNTADNGGNNIVVYITNDITLGSLYIESDEGKSVTLVLSDGVQVTVGHLILGNKGGNAKEVHFTVSGNGTISVTEDIRYKNTSSASTVTLENQAKIKAKNIFNEQGGEVSFSGDGTLSLSQATSTPAGVSIDSSVNYEDQNTVKVYYWDPPSTNIDWTTSENWRKDNQSGTRVPAGRYPGCANGDTAIIPAGNTVRNLTLADDSYSLTISNPTYVTGTKLNQRVSLVGTAEDYSASSITVKGYVLFNSCRVGGLQVSSGKLQISTAGANDFALTATNIEVLDGSKFLGYTSDSVTVSGSLTVKGSFTMAQREGTGVKNGTLTIRGSTSVESGGSLTLPAENTEGLLTSIFEGSVTNNGTFTGDGSVSFNSTVSNNGTFSCGSGKIICNGDYKSGAGASFKASSADTVFYGNADFSSGSFDANNGTVHFLTTNTDDSQKTMTTCSSQAFNRLRFGGNVMIVTRGTVTATELLMERYDSVTEYLSAAFTAQITGDSLEVSSKTALGVSSKYFSIGLNWVLLKSTGSGDWSLLSSSSSFA